MGRLFWDIFIVLLSCGVGLWARPMLEKFFLEKLEWWQSAIVLVILLIGLFYALWKSHRISDEEAEKRQQELLNKMDDMVGKSVAVQRQIVLTARKQLGVRYRFDTKKPTVTLNKKVDKED